MKCVIRSVLACLLTAGVVWQLAPVCAGAEKDDGKLRIICFGAHPDDCEFEIGGTAAKWAAMGHHVKFVSTTNGDIGHWRMSGGPLAKRRTAEVKEAAKILGIETEVLDIHDGEIMPTLENRKTFVRLIRRWKADVVISHRPNDYHPDHRYTGVLVQDSAYMVSVPFFCPDTPALKRNPVYLYTPDGFTQPTPFKADIAVSIDDVWDKKLRAIDVIVSQVHEGGVHGNAERVAAIPKDPKERLALTERRRGRGNQRLADAYRDLLIKWYGPEKGKAVKRAEAFQICEYGSRPNEARLKQIFPFFP
jgi:LmbE family N-acetylglucosaminyl deacetylase